MSQQGSVISPVTGTSFKYLPALMTWRKSSFPLSVTRERRTGRSEVLVKLMTAFPFPVSSISVMPAPISLSSVKTSPRFKT